MSSTATLAGRAAFSTMLIGYMMILVAGFSFAKDDNGRVKELFKRLEGRWKVASAEVSGQKIESDEEWNFVSGNYTWSDSKRKLRGYASINYTWDPHQIYFHHEHSSVTGPIETGDVRNWDSGIYKLSDDGETLKVCLGPLPSKEFATKKEDKRRLFVLKRVKADEPVK